MHDVSFSIMAHPARFEWAAALATALDDAPISMAHGRERDPVGNGLRAWRLAERLESEWHVVVQDDAVLCTDFRARLDEVIEFAPQPCAISLYYQRRLTPWRTAVAGLRNGGLIRPLNNGVAVALPSAWVPDMLRHYDFEAPEPFYDMRLRGWLLSLGLPTWYPLPSLVDHQGETSLVGNRGARRAWRFAG